MAIDKGYLGSVYVGANKVAELNNWDITFEAGQQETTSFGDTARKRAYTVKDISGSFSGYGDKSDTNGQNALINQFLSGGTPAASFLYLYVSGAQGYYGSALVTPGKSADTTALQTFTAAFVGADLWLHNIS